MLPGKNGDIFFLKNLSNFTTTKRYFCKQFPKNVSIDGHLKSISELRPHYFARSYCIFFEKFSLFKDIKSCAAVTQNHHQLYTTLLILLIVLQALLVDMVQCTNWSGRYGPPHGSLRYAEWYALHQNQQRMRGKYASTRPLILQQRTPKTAFSLMSTTQHPQTIHKMRPSVIRIKNKEVRAKETKTNFVKAKLPKAVPNSNAKSRSKQEKLTSIKNPQNRLSVDWCDYVERIFGIKKCEKNKGNASKMSSSLATKNRITRRPNLLTTGTARIGVPEYRRTITTLAPIHTTLSVAIRNGIDDKCELEDKLSEEHTVGNSKFEICLGFYGTCSQSHSCESNVACLHRITHQPCCTSPEINQQCPSVDKLGYECRKMNPVNWCNTDEDCGTSPSSNQICCPTGCGYNTCLRSPKKVAAKTFHKWSEKEEDCPNPSLIPIRCATQRPLMWCTNVDECMNADERRRRCCKTSCGYNICLTRLVDRWLIP